MPLRLSQLVTVVAGPVERPRLASNAGINLESAEKWSKSGNGVRHTYKGRAGCVGGRRRCTGCSKRLAISVADWQPASAGFEAPQGRMTRGLQGLLRRWLTMTPFPCFGVQLRVDLDLKALMFRNINGSRELDKVCKGALETILVYYIIYTSRMRRMYSVAKLAVIGILNKHVCYIARRKEVITKEHVKVRRLVDLHWELL